MRGDRSMTSIPRPRAPGPAPARGWRVRADASRGQEQQCGKRRDPSGQWRPFGHLALPVNMLLRAAGRAARSGAGSPERQRPGPTRREESRPAPAMPLRSVSRGATAARTAPNRPMPLRHSYSTVRHSMPAASRRWICAAGRGCRQRRRASAAGGQASNGAPGRGRGLGRARPGRTQPWRAARVTRASTRPSRGGTAPAVRHSRPPLDRCAPGSCRPALRQGLPRRYRTGTCPGSRRERAGCRRNRPPGGRCVDR